MEMISSAGEYGITTALVFGKESSVKNKLFQSKGTLQPMDLKFIDLQHVFKNTLYGRDFIQSLQKCKNIDFFSNPAVQMIIDHHWSYWRIRSLILLGLPLTCQLLLFMYYSNFVIPHATSTEYSGHQKVIVNLIIATNIYALLLEIPMIVARRWKWFTAVQNIVNFLSNVLQLYNSTINADVNSPQFWRIQTWVALLIWWRFVLYLRTFERFSWMIRLVQQSIYDMRFFLLIFLFIVLSFADAFLSIQNLIRLEKAIDDDGDIDLAALAESDDVLGHQSSFYQKYFKDYVRAIRMSYLTSIGEFDDIFDAYNDLEWLVFLMSTVINVIVLLNSLIAITGETFTLIWDSKIPKSYQEKVLQMQILQTGFGYFFKMPQDPNERLFVAQYMAGSHNYGPKALTVKEDIATLREDFDSLKTDLMAHTEDQLSKMAEVILTQSNNGVAKKANQQKRRTVKLSNADGARLRNDISSMTRSK